MTREEHEKALAEVWHEAYHEGYVDGAKGERYRVDSNPYGGAK